MGAVVVAKVSRYGGSGSGGGGNNGISVEAAMTRSRRRQRARETKFCEVIQAERWVLDL
jgi:hypothetical protein